MNITKSIVIALLVLCVAAGAAVSYQPHTGDGQPVRSVNAYAPATIPPARYQVIADIATMEQQIAELQRDLNITRADLREAQGQIGALVLLRAHDVQAWQTARAEDQKRLASVEWNVNRMWEVCR